MEPFHGNLFRPTNAQVSFKDMCDDVITPTAPRSSGLRGEGRFMVHDSRAGPGELTLRSVFPFSFYTFRLLQDLKTATSVVGSEEELQSSFALLQRGERLHGTLSRAAVSCGDDPVDGGGINGDETFLRQYVHDFTCMMLPSVRGVSRLDEAAYLLALLDVAGRGPYSQEDASCFESGYVASWAPVQSLAAVHHRFWREEHAVRLHFKLLDAAGPRAFKLAMNEVVSRLQQIHRGSSEGKLDPLLHMFVARAATVALINPEASKGRKEITGPGGGSFTTAWALHVENADRASTNLLQALVASCSDRDDGLEGNRQRAVEKELRGGWARLRLMQRLVTKVTALLPLSEEVKLSALEALSKQPHPVQSRNFLKTVLRVLASTSVNAHLCISPTGPLPSRVDAPILNVLSRFLEGYLAETFFDSSQAEGATVNDLCPEVEFGDLCHALVAVLSGNATLFEDLRDPSWSLSRDKVTAVLEVIWPREAACVQGLTRMRKWSSAGKLMGEVITDTLQAGLWRECGRAGGSCDNFLAGCFAVAVEGDTTIDQVGLRKDSL